MAEITYKQEIIDRIDRLTPDDQRKVLEFLRNIESQPEGVPGASLLRFVGTIPADDLERMAQAIEEDCERIDWDEW